MGPNQYDLSKSIVDTEKSCVSLLINTLDFKNDILGEALGFHLYEKIELKYKQYVFTHMSTILEKNEIKGFLFHFKKPEADPK